jgi:hypothetical protein
MQPTFRQVPPRVAATFHASGLEAQLAGADRRVITTGAAAQNHYVIVAHALAPD